MIPVLVADDHGFIRAGVEAVLRGTRFSVVAATASGEETLAAIKTHNPEIVLLGTGRRLRFPPAALTRSLAAARVGLEVMDTPAACRTYNILTGERRRVLAALLFDPD